MPRPASRRRGEPLSHHVEVTDAGHMRVGHEERERLVHVLMQQYAEGRLTAAELDDLSDRARAARTYADLDRLVTDLPVPPPSAGVRQMARPPTSPGSAPTRSTDSRRPAGCRAMSGAGLDRTRIPQPQRRMSTVKLDFQQAICPHDVVDISVSADVGAVVHVVPEGWGVNTDQIGKGIGSVSNKVDTIPHTGRPLPCSTAAQWPVRSRSGTEPARPLHDAPQPQAWRGRHPGRRSRHQRRPGMWTVPGIRPATPQDSPPQDAAIRRF